MNNQWQKSAVLLISYLRVYAARKDKTDSDKYQLKNEFVENDDLKPQDIK